MAKEGESSSGPTWAQAMTAMGVILTMVVTGSATVLYHEFSSLNDNVTKLVLSDTHTGDRLDALEKSDSALFNRLQDEDGQIKTLNLWKAEQDAKQTQQKINMYRVKALKAQHAATHLKNENNKIAEEFRSGKWIPASQPQPTQ